MTQTSPINNNTACHKGSIRTRIVMALGLLNLLLVLLVPRVLGHLQREEIDATEQVMDTAIQAIEQFAEDHYGRYPSTRESIGVLCSDADDPCVGTGGQYLDSVPVDAWGNELLYWCPGTFNRDTFDVSSAGPDGVFGNDDDITNWAE